MPSRSRALLVAFPLVAGGVAVAAGCSKSAVNGDDVDGGPAPCIDSACAQGNICLNDGVTVACRRPCVAQSGPQGCADGWTCARPSTGDRAFCRKDNGDYVPGPKQWGTPCRPELGADNPDCDTAAGFYCFGMSPTDANAVCTQYSCQIDADCRSGWHCAKVNAAPNLVQTRRTLSDTRTVCLPRSHCAPCQDSVDCAPLPDGRLQVCVSDVKGESRFCTAECERDSNCPLDAVCVDTPEVGKKTCFPRYGACKGDGQLCTPCASDDDCVNGYCLRASLSSEQFCSVKSKVPCTVPKCTTPADCPGGAACTDGQCEAVVSDCPKATGVPYAVGCAFDNDPDLPKDQCFGIVKRSGQNVLGCWSRKR